MFNIPANNVLYSLTTNLHNTIAFMDVFITYVIIGYYVHVSKIINTDFFFSVKVSTKAFDGLLIP